MIRAAALLACSLLAVAGRAPAQTVYRCGVEGRLYTQQPCVAGRAIEVGDARTDGQRRDAETQAQRQTRLAGTLERDRLEARALSPPPVRIDGRPQADSASPSPSRKTFRAVTGPTKKKPKRRAGVSVSRSFR